MRRVSLKLKTLLLSIVLPVTLVLIFTAVLFYLRFNAEYKDAERQLLSDARNIQGSIYLDISESFELLRNLAVNPLTLRVADRMNSVPTGLDNDDFSKLTEAPEMVELMGRVAEGTNAELVYMATIDSTGILLGRDVQIGEGFDVRGRDYYQGALQNPGRAFISQPRVSAEQTVEPKIVITAARAILDDNGRKAGIVALNYSFDPIIAIIRELMSAYSVGITLYDTEGEYLLWNEFPEGPYFYNPDDTIPLDQLAADLGYKPDSVPELISNLTGQEEYFFRGNTSEGPAMIQSIHIPDTRWAILVTYPLAAVYSSATASILPPLVAFLIAFLLSQIIMYVMTLRTMIRPIIGIGQNLKNLAEADADLTVAIPRTTNDEIGDVAVSFNIFVDKLRSLMNEVKIAIDGTESIGHRVSSSAEESSTAVEEISANLDSISSQIEVLDNSINDTVTAIEQVTQNIGAMDDQIVNQSAMVEESTAAITEMIASLENVNIVSQNKRSTTQALSEVASEGKSRIEETARTFKSVVDHIRQIQEMAATIDDIASQTNLLSMNAAIEAAHAGDSGRGFAVVAEEIRKLADSAGRSSQSITQTIKNITSSVAETEKNVGDTSAAFEKIAREVVDTVNAFTEIEHSVSELNTGGRQILESTNQINEVTVSIKNGSGEIKTGTSVMLNSSARIREVSERVTSGMNESTSGVQEIVGTMQLLVQVSQDLRTIVQKLKDDFGQFKT